MASSLTIILRNPSTGQGIPDKSVKLRVYPFSTDTYTATQIPGKSGAYQFNNVATGKYKLYVDDIEDTSFGGSNGKWIFDGENSTIPLDIIPSIPATKIANGLISNDEFDALNGITTNIQTQLDSKLSASGGQLAGNLDANNYKIINLHTSPSNSGDAIPLGYAEQTFLKKLSASAQTIYSSIELGDSELSHLYFKYFGPITHNKHIVTREFLEQKIQEYLSGSLTPFQESPNIIRIIYNGTQETNRVYTTIANAMNAAKSLASENRHITCVIHGNGLLDNLPTNANKYQPTDINLYCHLHAIHPNTIVHIEENQYICGLVAGDLGKIILSNLVITGVNEAHQTSFKRFVFENCIFNFPNAGQLTIEDCYLKGSNTFIIGGGGLFNVLNTKGNLYHTTLIPNETGNNPPYILSSNL